MLTQRQVYIVLFALQGFFGYCQPHLQRCDRGYTLPGQLSPSCGANPAPARLPAPALRSRPPSTHRRHRPTLHRRQPGGGHGACRPPPRPPHLLRGEGLSPVVQHQRRHARGTGGRPAARNERRGTALRCGGRGGRPARARSGGRSHPALGNSKKGVPGGAEGTSFSPALFRGQQFLRENRLQNRPQHPFGKRRKMDA